MADQNKFDTTHWDADSVRRESQGEPEKPRREKKKKINWLAYTAFVLIVSALLAGIGWLLANDLCALNKKPLTATITVAAPEVDLAAVRATIETMLGTQFGIHDVELRFNDPGSPTDHTSGSRGMLKKK